ncbi:MAG: hypothetical protein GX580_17750 [Candidatus Hydrogenedens sp.]|nr:hypothetical protein [Candidatus Hydrogenedentota bacterium]NLF59473.1 hypothetical protein [Candidatus Hydrogenedens sp.]
MDEPARTPPVVFPGSPPKPEPSDGAQSAPSHAERLRTLMRHSADPAARARALETLPLDREAEARLNACAQSLSDPDPAVRGAALKCLLESPAHDLFAHVIRTMAWGEPDRVTALDAVLPQLAPKITSLLEETLNTELETPRHRRAAAYCLGRMGAASSAPALARHAWSTDGELAVTCALALAMLRDPGTLNDWLALLEHPDNTVRVLAVRALADLGTQAAWVALRDAAAGRRANTAPAREEAARMLASLPPGDAVPALITTMRANRAMGAPCARLLRQITGHNFGPDPEAWERGLFEEQLGDAPLVPDAGE